MSKDLNQGLKLAGANSPIVPKIWCGLLKFLLFLYRTTNEYMWATKFELWATIAKVLSSIPDLK